MGQTLPGAGRRCFFRIAHSRRCRRPGPHQDETARDRRGAGGRATVLRGGHPLQFLEPGAERAHAFETDAEADLGDGEVGDAQEVLGPLDPATGEIGARRLPVGPGEGAREVELGEPGRRRHRVQRQRLREVSVGQVAGPPQGLENLRVRHPGQTSASEAATAATRSGGGSARTSAWDGSTITGPSKPISPSAARKPRVSMYRADLDLVLSKPDGSPYDPDETTRRFEGRAASCPAVLRIRFHDMRYTHASSLLEAGETIK